MCATCSYGITNERCYESQDVNDAFGPKGGVNAGRPGGSRGSAATDVTNKYLQIGVIIKETTYKRATNGEFINLIEFLGVGNNT